MNIYIDTETTPTTRADVIAWLAARHDVMGARDGLDALKRAEAVDKARRETSLSPVFGELAVVAIGVDGSSDPTTYVRAMDADGAWAPGSERDLCLRVSQALRDIIDDVGRRNVDRIVAFNAEFDRVVLRTRCMVHDVKLPRDVAALDVKPWDSLWYCAMEPLRLGRSGVSLDGACLAMGVGLPKGDIDGSRVWDAVLTGRLDDVARYCADDVRRVRAVYQRIMGVRG